MNRNQYVVWREMYCRLFRSILESLWWLWFWFSASYSDCSWVWIMAGRNELWNWQDPLHCPPKESRDAHGRVWGVPNAGGRGQCLDCPKQAGRCWKRQEASWNGSRGSQKLQLWRSWELNFFDVFPDLQFLGGFRVFQLDIGSWRQGAPAPTSGRTVFFFPQRRKLEVWTTIMGISWI